MAGEQIRCIVVTPERTVVDQSADSVVFPAYDGDVGVYPKRAPLVARLGPGELRLMTGTVQRRFFIEGGFGQVRDDVVTILTSKARAAEELDAEALRTRLSELSAQVPNSDEAIDEKLERQDQVRAMLRIAEHAPRH